MSIVLVAESMESWLGGLEGVHVVDPTDYLTNPEWNLRRGTKVYNLCSSYGYQSLGYYVSLLAEARGHRPIPDVMTIEDLRGTAAVRIIPQDLEALIQTSLAPLASDEFVLSVYFGENLAKRYSRLCKELYSLFQAPLMQFKFARRKNWQLRRASILGLKAIPEAHREFVAEAAKRHFAGRNPGRRQSRTSRFDLAILHDPREGEMAPSDDVALKRFIKAAAAVGVAAELITREDAGRLLEFDALFIRETTSVPHHTYRLARRAEASGMVVIDDPQSILRCTNKVYLAELMHRAGIPAPKTVVVHRGNETEIARSIGFPCVLKRPDSAFSQGVVKADDAQQMSACLKELLVDSELVIVQEFKRTDFDWRIGIMDQRPLFACKYHMARGHWQIAKHDEGRRTRFGKCETLPVELAPRKAVSVALKAANLIGNGLYGVDVKECDGKFYVIEVNDNPNIDSGVEDAVLREELYRRIIESFVRRLERAKQLRFPTGE